MRIGRAKELRRHERVEYGKPFQGVSAENTFGGMIRDISPGGAALALDILDSHLSNYDFIELHIQSLDRKIPSQVVRRYEGGVAVKFDVSAAEEKQIQGELDKFKTRGGTVSGA